MTHKSKIKELVGRGLNSYHAKALKQIDRIEKKNKEQNYKIGNLVNELDNDYITKAEEGSVISLEHSKEGMVYIDELEGNTLVNYCADGSKELTLNDEIDTEGINVTLNNTIDNGIVDISLEGNTMVNVCDQKDPVAITKSYTVESSGNHIPLQGEYDGKARPIIHGNTLVNVCDQKDPIAITKSYTVENSGNHIALQGEYDGKARPVIQGNTLVNYVTDGAKELTLNGDIDVEGTNVTLNNTIDNGKVDVSLEGNTMVNVCTHTNTLYPLQNENKTNQQIFYINTLYELDTTKQYTLFFTLTDISNPSGDDVLAFQKGDKDVMLPLINGTQTYLFTPGNRMVKNIRIPVHSVQSGHYGTISDVMILEGDYTNKEIPTEYFEGMKSVGECEDNKIEILGRKEIVIETEVGDINKNTGVNESSTKRTRARDYTEVKPNAEYKLTRTTVSGNMGMRYYDSNKNFITGFTYTNTDTHIFTTPSDCKYLRFIDESADLNSIHKLILTKDSDDKKEISLNEPLRSLPNGVKDRFVKQGGKWYVERNCGQIVLDGSEGWQESVYTRTEHFRAFWGEHNWYKQQTPTFNNILPNERVNIQGRDVEGVYISNTFDIQVSHSKLNTVDLDGLRQWLSQNHITVIYQLNTPIYEPIETDISLLTYLDTTYISNNSIIPCNMKITNTGYNTIIKPNTKYTIVLDTNKAGTIGINLGGTEISTSNKITTITTPSTLVDNTLKLSGQGINVDKVMLFEGDLTQTPSLMPNGYVEGLKSSFEDQLVTDENDVNYGKYKVEYRIVGKNKFDKNKELQAINYKFDNKNHQVDFNDDYIRVKYGLYGGAVYLGNIGSFKKGTYVLSCECYSETLGTPDVNIGYFVNDGWKHRRSYQIVNPNTWEKFKYTFTLENDTDSLYLQLQASGSASKYDNLDFRVRNIQLEEGSQATEYQEYKESIKTFYLNSPLLEGDTIEDINGKATHVKRYDQVIFNGSEDWIYQDATTSCNMYLLSENAKPASIPICDRFIGTPPKTTINHDSEGIGIKARQDSKGEFVLNINKTKLSPINAQGFKQWLSENPITVVYQLVNPQYETISEESILCDSYTNGHLDFDTNVPVERVQFGGTVIPLVYQNISTKYKIQFESDNAGVIYGGYFGGSNNPAITNKSIQKGINTLELSTGDGTLTKNIYLNGIGFNASNIQVVATDDNTEFGYFEGLKSSFEDQLIKDENDPNCGKYKVEYRIVGKNKFNIIKEPEFRYTETDATIAYKNDTLVINGTLMKHYNNIYMGSVKVSKGKTYNFSCNRNIDLSTWHGVSGHLYNKGKLVKDYFIYYKGGSGAGDVNFSFSIPTNADVDELRLFTTLTWQNTPVTYDNLIISSIQVEEGSTKTTYEPYKEYTKTFYLNSPLLEGDTIEDVNGVATHVKRYGKVVLDGSENWAIDSNNVNYIHINYWSNPPHKQLGVILSDKFISAFSSDDVDNKIAMGNAYVIMIKSEKTTSEWVSWLQANPTTVVYQLASPIYEPISTESILCDSYVNGHLDFDSAIPVKKVAFGYNAIALKYVQPSTKYTIQFESDGVGKVELLNIGGKTYPYLNKDVVKGLNKITVETIQSPTHNLLIMVGIGFNASNISVVETDKEFRYFEGMKSVGECEDNKIKILSAKVKEYITGTLGVYSVQKKPIFNFIDNPTNGEASSSELEPYLKYFNDCGSFYNCDNLFDYYRVNEGYWVNLGVWGTTYNDSLKAKEVINKYIGECEGNKKEITLSEPLRALPNGVCDKVMKIGGKWYVERNIGVVSIPNQNFVRDISTLENENTNKFYVTNHFADNGFLPSKLLSDKIPSVDMSIMQNVETATYPCLSNSTAGSFNVRTPKNITTSSECKTWLKNLNLTMLAILKTPIYEPLEVEPTLTTYNDITHISNNSTIPCNMTVKNTGYNAIIKPSTQYTVAFDTNKSGTIGTNLGGAKVTTTNNVATITTPSTLVDDSLRLTGKGIKASKIRLLEGDKTNWIPSHFEGMKSSFEDKLQDDGTFKMEILSNNENLFDVERWYTFIKSKQKGYFEKVIEDGKECIAYRPHGLYQERFMENEFDRNTQYTLSYSIKDTLGRGVGLTIFYTDGSYSSTWSKETSFVTVTKTSDIGKTIKFIGLYYNHSDIGYIDINSINLVKSITIDEYTPQKSNKIQFSSIEPLRGVGDVKDRFVFNKDGKLMIERNCGVKFIDGSDVAHTSIETYPSDNAHCILTSKFNNLKLSSIVCDKLPAYTPSANDAIWMGTSIRDKNGISTVNDAWGFAVRLLNSLTSVEKTDNYNTVISKFKTYLNNNPITVIYQLAEPTYEEVPFELAKIILEGYENGTLFFDTNIPPTVTTTYAGETPIVKSVRLNKTEVLKNTDDINDNIVPYLMDMDFRVVCLQLEGGVENISMAKLFGGTYEMLQRDIQSKRYSVDEYKYRLEAYLSANKITQEEYEKLGGMLNE